MNSPTTEHARAAAKVAALLEGKAVVGAVREYQVQLERLINRALSSGGISASEFRADHKSLIREYGPEAFNDGLKAGGVDDGPDDEDDEVIRAWIAEQLTHVADFAAYVTGARKLDPEARASAEREATRRGVLWVQAMENLQALGKASALKNMMVTWKLGRTEKHCGTCASLNGKRRRLKWFTERDYLPQQVGSETLECGGWNCDCTLRDDKGKVVLP